MGGSEAPVLAEGSTHMTTNDDALQQRPVADRGGLLARYLLPFYFIIACAGSWLVALPYVRFGNGAS